MMDERGPVTAKFTRDRRRRFERHVQSILLALVVLVIGWAGKTLEQLNISAPATDLRLSNIEVTLSGMKPAMEAARDTQRDIKNFEARLSANELISVQHQVIIERNRDEIAKVEQQLRMTPPRTPALTSRMR